MVNENAEKFKDMKFKAIVTGGAGFIGSHLVGVIIKKIIRIIVIDNFATGRRNNLNKVLTKIKIVNADISNEEKIQKYFKNIDYVFHLAGLALLQC